jgi:hypothetical protein
MATKTSTSRRCYDFRVVLQQPGSQHQMTMRNLAQYECNEDVSGDIKAKRKIVVERLRRQLKLQQSGSPLTLDMVRALIFEANIPDFGAYATIMLSALGSTDAESTDDPVVQIIEDSWNLLPHRFLGGRCPTEVFDIFQETASGSSRSIGH